MATWIHNIDHGPGPESGRNLKKILNVVKCRTQATPARACLFSCRECLCTFLRLQLGVFAAEQPIPLTMSSLLHRSAISFILAVGAASAVIIPGDSDFFLPLNGSSDLTATCPKYNVYKYVHLKQCPTFITDSCCTVRLPGDVDYKPKLKCTMIDPFPNNTLHQLSSKSFQTLTQMRDACGRPWCMVSLFYSSSCLFSAKVANRFGELAEIYPHLFVVAVNVANRDPSTDFLISHYGIAATPVIVFWENGFPRFKVTETPGDFDSLVHALKDKSDLKYDRAWIPDTCTETPEDCPDELYSYEVAAYNRSNEFRSSFVVSEDMQYFDWYLILAIVALLAQVGYMLEARRLNDIPWKDFKFTS
uniref:Thioredoxin domain-containing protein n=1 Tax=Panagrellus redivivus TaxID=6233 RepID=A0A7E4VHH3_PANRE